MAHQNAHQNEDTEPSGKKVCQKQVSEIHFDLHEIQIKSLLKSKQTFPFITDFVYQNPLYDV